jgi:hypothetical protein
MRVVLALEAPSDARAMASASAAELQGSSGQGSGQGSFRLPNARAKRPRRQAAGATRRNLLDEHPSTTTRARAIAAQCPSLHRNIYAH